MLRLLAAAIGVLGVAVLAFAPHYDPLQVHLDSLLQPPSAAHWFGTDQYGRDLFSRVLAAGPLSLAVCGTATLIALVIGVALGGTAGYYGGWIDSAVSAVVDSLAALPALLLALLIMGVLGPSSVGVATAVGLASVPSVARVMRGAVLSVREKDYVLAARMLRPGELRVFRQHVAPNCIAPILVLAATLGAQALLIESALSFLGLGAPPPTATWGGLLGDSAQFLVSAPWLGLFPGVTLSACVIAINFAGDGLRERLDPKLRS
ncbi:MAG: ABC transporter permease [Acetobacteraceae bacterium]